MDDLTRPQQLFSALHQSLPGTSSGVHFTQPYDTTSRFATPALPGGAGPIRRRRFSAAKIQPTRIKKVMQSDEEIGRMVASVPVSIGRAMEHFAEKFLLAAAACTQNSNSRTLTPAHMKQAMLANPHFRFLESVLGEVGIPGRPMDIDLSAEANAGTLNVSPLCSPMDVQQFQGMNNAVMSPAAFSNMNDFQRAYQDAQAMKMHMHSLRTLQEFVEKQTPSPANDHVQSPVDMSAEAQKKIEMENMRNMEMWTQKNLTAIIESVSQDKHDVSAGGKQAAAETEVVVEKPKRGRPRKVKKDAKCLDEDLCKEVSNGIEQEDKDRKLMPPPALPIGGLPRSRTKQVA